MSRRKRVRGRLRGKIIKKLFLSMFLSMVFFIIGSVIIYVTTSDGLEAERFAELIAKEVPEEIDDIKDIYLWSGWEDMNPDWKVEVYDSTDELIFTNDTHIIMPSLWTRTERRFGRHDARIVINSIAGKKTRAYMDVFHLFAWVTFFGLFTLFFRKIEKYTYEISDGISILAGGEMNHRIRIESKDELSMIASNINGMAEALQVRTAEKEKSDKERDDMITNLAHDIRTPITVLEGYLTMLITDKNITESKRMEYMNIALNKCNELSARADSIFEFVRLSNKKEDLKLSSINAKAFVLEKFEEMTMILSQEGFRFDVNINLNGEERITTDKMLSQRVFDNLLSNIIKYADNEYPIELNAYSIDDEAIITFKNKASQNIDIDADRLFDRTVSGDVSRNSKSEGLGLAICKLIVEMQGGNIKAEIEDGFIEFKLQFLN